MAQWHKVTPEIREALEGARSSSCFCEASPCQCNSGWGTFETEGQLMAAISGEIAASEQQLREEHVHPDTQAVFWLDREGMDVDGIAESLEIPVRQVEQILSYGD